MSEQKNGPIENLLEGLDQQSELLTTDELKADLQERGINVQKFLEETKGIIAKFDKEDRLAWMKIADQKKSVIEKTQISIVSWVGRNTSEIKEAFHKFQQSVSAETSFAYRNKGELTVEDMARILDDQQRLQSRCSDNEKRND